MNKWHISRLRPPQEKVNLILDTDTYNEIDDQFALVYSIIARDRLNLLAITAAPFDNERSLGPADGMEKSYDEILRVLDLLGVSMKDKVFPGSKEFLSDSLTPIRSAAAEKIVELAKAHDPLYVAAIGAITNVASALLMDPSIADSLVVVWLGGHPLYWPNNLEFNLKQDPIATNVVLDSGVPFVQIPCKNVAEHIKTSVPELRSMLEDKGEIGRYLCEIFAEYLEGEEIASKEIWDLAAIAWLIDDAMLPSTIVPAPRLNDDKLLSWNTENLERHPFCTATDAKRDLVFRDFVTRLDSFLKNR